MAGGLGFNREGQFTTPNSRQQLFAGLDGPFGPAMLLRFETIHVHRQFGGRHEIGKENEFPTDQLRAIAKIEIFAKRVVVPAAGFLDARFSPQTGSAIEIEKASAAAAGGLLEQEMAVQKHRLHPCEQRIPAIQMSPASLDHANLRVVEIMNRVLQKIARRNEVRVQNANEFAVGRFKSNRESARFEPGPINAMNQLHIETALAQFLNTTRGDFARVIG